MIQNDAHSCDFRSKHIRSRIYALWQREHELLEDAAIELSVDLEVFAAEGSSGVKDQPAGDEVAFLRAWLKAQNYPNGEPYPESVLDDLNEQELYLALAKFHLDLSTMTEQGAWTAEDQLYYRNVALTVSERVLTHAERLSSRVH